MTHIQDYETGASQLEDFLYNTADVSLDNGTAALASTQNQLWTPRHNQGTSLDFVQQEGADYGNGLVELYSSRHDSQRLKALGSVMAGAYVIAALTPDIALPSAVAATQENASELTLWMWRQPWRVSGITEDQTQVLAAATQLEAPGAGQHHTKQTAGEAQHLLSMLSIAQDPHSLNAWQNGQHINHSTPFRAKGTLPAVSGTLLDQQYQVSRLQIRQQPHHSAELSIDGSPYQHAPQFRLLWHKDSMQAATEQGVRVCDSSKAITIVQGAGFMAVSHAVGNIERVINGNIA